jgi:hypothetical protein
MGIIKQAKNIKIVVNNDYFIKAGKINEISDKVNIESLKENLSLNSNKQIQQKGNDGGVKHQSYTPQELKIEESEYKLESTFAMDQLFSFAEKDSKAMLSFWMTDIFGGNVPLDAYEKLYKDASDKKESVNPKITVAKEVHGFGAMYYSGIDKNGNPIKDKNEKYKNHIIISQGFIDTALENNEYKKLLMIALVEEFGHHLDYLLRFEYSSKKGDSQGDEGARYTAQMNRAYKRYLIDPFEKKEQHYATATIKGEEKKLVWNFADLHKQLKEYVDNRVDFKDDHFAGFEFFSAGLGDGHGEYGHQTVEINALKSIFDEKTIIPKIYLGNWLRDFSQFVDAGLVRPLSSVLNTFTDQYKAQHKGTVNKQSAIDNLEKFMSENQVTYRDSLQTMKIPVGVKSYLKAELDWQPTTLSPVKLTREAITSVVALLGVNEFGEKKTEENKPENYTIYLQNFKDKYFEINTRTLGVYRPEEHIDNPSAYFPKKGGKPDLDHELDPDYAKSPVLSQFSIDKDFGTKNYIRGNGIEPYGSGVPPFPSAYDCFISYLEKAMNGGKEKYMNFGAAMHILEDLYAHSNFCELAVIKTYDPEVYPWFNQNSTCLQGKLNQYKSDFRQNSHVSKSYVNRSRIKYNTVSNTALQSVPYQNSGLSADRYYNSPDNQHRRGLYYSHAECAPLQTGSFSKIDMIASIAPKLNNKVFSIKVDLPEDVEEGERTFSDALILEFLRDISKAQAADTKETNPKYLGKDNDKYAQVYMEYLDLRDAYLHKNALGFSMKDLFSAFGIMGYITEYLKVIQNYFYHELLVMIINQIDLLQIALDNQLDAIMNGTWKIDELGPTHTQIAKDNGMQPFHGLAIKLATDAVQNMGKLMQRVWSGNVLAKAEIRKLADEYFRHPMLTDWADEEVIKWCKEHPFNVERARTDTIIFYGILVSTQEIRKLMDDVYLLHKRFQDMKTKDQNELIDNTLYPEQRKKWFAVRDKLFKTWKMPKYIKTYNPKYEQLSKSHTAEEAEIERQERLKQQQKK